MNNFRVGGSRFSRFMNGKGFYIALALCLIAIGSAAYIAANSSIGMISGNNTAGSSKTKGNNAAQSAFVWDNASEAEQTNRTVSGVPYKASSCVNSPASGASSVQGANSGSYVNSEGEKLVFMMPVNGVIITKYSPSTPIYDKTFEDWRVHNGVDISADVSTPVEAVADGTVFSVTNDVYLGETVVIDHGNGLQSVYGNLTKNVTVKKGQTVNAGDIIGCIGKTAQGEISLVPHLHFAMTKDGKYIDPLSFVKKG